MDRALFEAINGLAGRSAVLDRLVVDWAKYGAVVLGILVIAAWFIFAGDPPRATPRRAAVLAVAAALIALGIAQLIGAAWFRERPYVGHDAHLLVPPSPDASFPSDHAIGAAALATPFLLDRGTRLYGLALALLGVTLGLARVFVGLHFPGDVLGGFVLGAAVAYVLVVLAALADRRAPALWAPVLAASTVTDHLRAAARQRLARTHPATR